MTKRLSSAALSRFWTRYQSSLALADLLGEPMRSARSRRPALAVEELEDRAVPSVSQWADTVVNFSSQFGGGWSASAALGEPNVFAYGDIPGAWAPAPRNGTLEFITVGYNTPVYASA